MKIAARVGIAGICLAMPFCVLADPAQTLDLKAFVTPSSPVEKMGAGWLVPRGRQVLDGIPFQIDGEVLFHARNSGQKGLNVVTNLSNLAVGEHFEKLHLLAATDVDGTNAAAIAKIHLFYEDGSENTLDLNFGEHLRAWVAPWHKAEEPLKSPDAHVVWIGQHSGAAQSDKFLRFFHVTLNNPTPDKEVRALMVESAHTQYGLLLLGMTIAPPKAEVLPDTVSAAHSPFPDLRPRQGQPARGEGVVKDKDGHPLAGARIRIAAVRELNTDDKSSTTKNPAVGLGAETDENGHFTLPPLPDDKLYRLLVYAMGYGNSTYRGLDPKSDPIEIRLKPLANNSSEPKFAVHGRVITSDGKPVPFAIVEHDGVGYNGGTSWGGNQDFPDQVIADARGEFIFGRDQEFSRLQIKISVPGYAPAHLWLDVTNTTQTVTLTEGASIHGRVLKDGQPLTDVKVGVSGAERNSEVFAGYFEVKTGTNGEFVFEHLQPDTSWQFEGKMATIKKYGALPPRLVSSGSDGQSTDLGDLQVVPAIHLAGQIKTRNGEPLPKKINVSVGYDDAWDSQNVNVDKNGHFKFEGLSPRLVTVNVDAPNWKLSGVNRSLDEWNSWRMIGQLEGDKDDLVIIIEKGERQYNGYSGSGNGQLPAGDMARARPLRGAEDSGPPDIILAGTVLDDQTGQPVRNFNVVPGYKPPVTAGMPTMQKPLLKKILEPLEKKPPVPWNERICWQMNRNEPGTNGTFSVRFQQLSSRPVVRIEASGYEPLESEPFTQMTTNLVLRLKKGSGPDGIVLLPNGVPAKDATVVYGVSQEQFSLQDTSITSYGQTNSVQNTMADGKFAFLSRADESMIFVAHPAGWAEQSLDRARNNLKLELRPWASLTGTLINSNGAPMPGVKLALTMFHDWQQGGALVNLQHQAVTDAQGHFLFTNVPPARVEVQRMVPFRAGGWSYQEQSWLFVQPGITNDLGKVTYDHPPPPPAMEQIKQKLGL